METPITETLDTQVQQLDFFISKLREQHAEVQKRTYLYQEQVEVQLWLVSHIENQIVFCEMQKTRILHMSEKYILR